MHGAGPGVEGPLRDQGQGFVCTEPLTPSELAQVVGRLELIEFVHYLTFNS
jgi:hypothetical protein